ncbi:DUF2127 domain-containing protein [Nonomuraea sp. NPDC003804]|uniref:DUF2127 domain-containing protein n=1 Tax=Nonomuraea sp. NPDC003804 TaxID=3154547 RepID=UPI0033BA88C4
MDWSLRACSRRGHVTYAPDEPHLRRRLRADTTLGEVWRCLRCGDFTLGPPHGTGPADEAPLVLRGRALRDAAILRLLALERFARALLLFLAAYGVWRFKGGKEAINRAFEEYLPLLMPLAERLGWRLADSKLVLTLHQLLATGTRTLTLLTVALTAYGVILVVESVGLWLLKRWGEYFAVIATSVFIPLEIYELSHRITWIRVTLLVVNLAAVAYIVVTKRLFGVRGGRAAHEAERHEASLLEVQTAGTR